MNRLRDVVVFACGVAIWLHQAFIAEKAQTILVASALAGIVGTPALVMLLRFWTRDRGDGGPGGGRA